MKLRSSTGTALRFPPLRVQDASQNGQQNQGGGSTQGSTKPTSATSATAAASARPDEFDASSPSLPGEPNSLFSPGRRRPFNVLSSIHFPTADAVEEPSRLDPHRSEFRRRHSANAVLATAVSPVTPFTRSLRRKAISPPPPSDDDAQPSVTEAAPPPAGKRSAPATNARTDAGRSPSLEASAAAHDESEPLERFERSKSPEPLPLTERAPRLAAQLGVAPPSTSTPNTTAPLLPPSSEAPALSDGSVSPVLQAEGIRTPSHPIPPRGKRPTDSDSAPQDTATGVGTTDRPVSRSSRRQRAG